MAQSFHGTDALKFARVHKQVPVSDTVDLSDTFRLIRCVIAGTAVIVDELGTALTYNFQVGDELSFSPRRINATGTTAAFYGYL